LNKKAVAFITSGILNRDKLRGTIGYMSPELILCGYCSQAAVRLFVLIIDENHFTNASVAYLESDEASAPTRIFLRLVLYYIFCCVGIRLSKANQIARLA
jgi:hypothetical protein